MTEDASKDTSYPVVGIYEHYKSTPQHRRYYQLVGFARHTETEEKLALYIPLYITPELTGLRLQARPLSMFSDTVTYNRKLVPRFTFISTEL